MVRAVHPRQRASHSSGGAGWDPSHLGEPQDADELRPVRESE
jgi:hypothetical protein